MVFQPGILSFSDTWKKALHLYARNWFPLLLIALLSVVPTFPVALKKAGENSQASDFYSVLRLLAWFIFNIAMSTAASGLMIELVTRKLQGRYRGMINYLRYVLPFFSAILVLSFIIAFAVGIGLIALVFPGAYIALCMSVAVESMVVERKGVWESIRRSFFLTQGKKVEILLHTLLLFAINFSLEQFLSLIISGMGISGLMLNAEILPVYLAQILAAPLGTCVFLLVYFNIRLEKEPGSFLDW